MCARLLLDKGAEAVGAVTRETHLGRGTGRRHRTRSSPGCHRRRGPVEAFGATHPDVVIVATSTYLEDVFDSIAGVRAAVPSAITTAEELLYERQGRSPRRTAELDELARHHGVTVVGSGYTDYFWGGEVTQLAGCCQRVDRLEGVGQFNIDDYGPQVARNDESANSVAEFAAAFSSRPPGRRPSSRRSPTSSAPTSASRSARCARTCARRRRRRP